MDRRGEYDHVSGRKVRIDFFHVVFLDTFSFPFGMAVLTAETWPDIHAADAAFHDLMARALCAF